MGDRSRPSTRRNPGVTDGTEQRKQSCLLVFGRLTKKMAKSLMQRVELAADRGRCGPVISRGERTGETDAAAEYQDHASPQTSGATPEGKSEVLDYVQQTS